MAQLCFVLYCLVLYRLVLHHFVLRDLGPDSTRAIRRDQGA